MRYVGNLEVLDRYVGNAPVLRRYVGSTLVHEWEADLTTALPSWIGYARAGSATRWIANGGDPILASVAADTPRFDVDWKTGAVTGLLFEGDATNICGYGRGATQTNWTATNVTVTTQNGADGTANKARRLAAGAANATYTYASSLVTTNAAGVWVFGAMVRRQAGYGGVWLQLTHDTNVIESRDITADLQVFKADEVTARFVPVFVSAYAGANALVSVGFKIETSGDAIEVDFPQLELSPNGRGYPTSPIETGGVPTAARNTDRLFIVRASGSDELILTGEAVSHTLSEVTYRDLGDWRDREERHLRSLRCIRTAQGSHDWRLTLTTPAENRANSGWHPGAPSAIVYEDIYPDLPGHYSNQLIPVGYGFTQTFADTEFVGPALSACTGTPTAYNTATLGVTTDEGNGTLYWIVSTSATPPSVPSLVAGRQADGTAAPFATSAAVASSGGKTANATGLAATTSYYTHACHVDAAGNASAIATSGQWTTPSAYTPQAITSVRNASDGAWYVRRATPGFATNPQKLSYCVVVEATGLASGQTNFICNNSNNEVAYAAYNASNPQRINVRQNGGGVLPVNFTFSSDIGLQKVALFVAVDFTNITTGGGKARVRAVTGSGLLDAANDKITTDTLNFPAYGGGINLGNGGSNQIGLLKAPATGNRLAGKVGLFWMAINQFIDWDTAANRDALIEIVSGILRPRAIDYANAANGAVAGVTPDVWMPFCNDTTNFAFFTQDAYTAYNRGSLSSVTLTREANASAGNWS